MASDDALDVKLEAFEARMKDKLQALFREFRFGQSESLKRSQHGEGSDRRENQSEKVASLLLLTATIGAAPIASLFLPTCCYLCSSTVPSMSLSPSSLVVATVTSSLAYGLQLCSLLCYSIATHSNIVAATFHYNFHRRATIPPSLLPATPSSAQPLPALLSPAFCHLQPRHQPLPPLLLSLPPWPLLPLLPATIFFLFQRKPSSLVVDIASCSHAIVRPLLLPIDVDHGPPATPWRPSDLAAALFLFPCLSLLLISLLLTTIVVAVPPIVAVGIDSNHRPHHCCSSLPSSLPLAPAASFPSLLSSLFPDQQITPFGDLGDDTPNRTTTTSSSL
ncbi:hypothetical protein BHE74_00051158 [Ensete ventricosum]|nr:hypothetical protein BHE74_00051158 [Ensete ventricosum]